MNEQRRTILAAILGAPRIAAAPAVAKTERPFKEVFSNCVKALADYANHPETPRYGALLINPVIRYMTEEPEKFKPERSI